MNLETFRLCLPFGGLSDNIEDGKFLLTQTAKGDTSGSAQCA